MLSVVPSMAQKTGGPAIGQVQATLAMGAQVRRSIFCTDAAQPASATKFDRITQESLTEGADRIDVRVFPTRRPRSFAYSPAMFRAIGNKIGDVDLVTIHSLNLFPQFAAYMHAHRSGTPYIVTPHGALDPWLKRNSPKRKAINNFIWQSRMLSQASALHFTTDEESRLVADLAPGVPRYIVPNGVQVDDFRRLPGRQEFREKFLDGYPGSIILFLGRIAKKKGLDLLLASFARIQVADSALLVIVGPDDENLIGALTRQAAELGVGNKVRFVGELYGDDQRAALASADIWALTSYTENFGNAVLEAMAAGLPVVISSAVNVAPDVAAFEAGCVTSLDADEIAFCIRRLLANPAERARLGKRAQIFAVRYDWSTVAGQLIDMYRDVTRAAVRRRSERRAARQSGSAR